jgi:hypothetical protein
VVQRTSVADRVTYLLVATLLFVSTAVLLGLALASPASGGHDHGGNAQCWPNGYGDGADNDGYAHPFVHYGGDAQCGFNSLGTNQRVSQLYCVGTIGACDFERIYYKHCGLGYHCHADLAVPNPECRQASGVIAETAIAHHQHLHHYSCVFI